MYVMTPTDTFMGVMLSALCLIIGGIWLYAVTKGY